MNALEQELYDALYALLKQVPRSFNDGYYREPGTAWHKGWKAARAAERALAKAGCKEFVMSLLVRGKPKHGDTAVCGSCLKKIQYVDQGESGYWSHCEGRSRHVALPVEGLEELV